MLTDGRSAVGNAGADGPGLLEWEAGQGKARLGRCSSDAPVGLGKWGEKLSTHRRCFQTRSCSAQVNGEGRRARRVRGLAGRLSFPTKACFSDTGGSPAKRRLLRAKPLATLLASPACSL